MTQKAERYVTLWKSQGKSFTGCDPSYNMIYLTWLEYFASVFPGITSIIRFIAWFEILTNSREGVYFFKSIIACHY